MCAIISTMPDRNSTAEVERLFLGLADRTRLRLLNLMGDQIVCVCYFVEILGLPQPTISRHLAYLRRMGLVLAHREGKWMHYRIAVPANQFARQILKTTLLWLESDKDMQRDRSRLTSACCAPQKFVNLQGAPAPTLVPELFAERN
jgi:ArsR family transcriptional regulator